MHLVGFTKEITNILGFSTKRKKAVYEDHLRPYSFFLPISLFAHASIRSPARPPVRPSARPPFCLSVPYYQQLNRLSDFL